MISHKCTEEENQLINELVEIEKRYKDILEERKNKRMEILKILGDRHYIYNDKYMIEYVPENQRVKMDIDKIYYDFPYVYEQCLIKTNISEHIRLTRR